MVYCVTRLNKTHNNKEYRSEVHRSDYRYPQPQFLFRLGVDENDKRGRNRSQRKSGSFAMVFAKREQPREDTNEI